MKKIIKGGGFYKVNFESDYDVRGLGVTFYQKMHTRTILSRRVAA